MSRKVLLVPERKKAWNSVPGKAYNVARFFMLCAACCRFHPPYGWIFDRSTEWATDFASPWNSCYVTWLELCKFLEPFRSSNWSAPCTALLVRVSNAWYIAQLIVKVEILCSHIDSFVPRFWHFPRSDKILKSNINQRQLELIIEQTLSCLGNIMHKLRILLLRILIPNA